MEPLREDSASRGLPLAALVVAVLGFLLLVLFHFSLTARLDGLTAAVGTPGKAGSIASRLETLEAGSAELQGLKAALADMQARLAALDGVEDRAVLKGGLADVAAQLRAVQGQLEPQAKGRLEDAAKLLSETLESLGR